MSKPNNNNQEWEERFDKRFNFVGCGLCCENTEFEGKDPVLFIKDFISQELSQARAETIELILGEQLKTQMTADVNRGDGTGNVDLTSVEWEAIFTRILSKLKKSK